ncbi:hypothetical protein B0H13DRAFT_1611837 [Mycena leptocephala]|nr:hypothetical protein B0H13DRAFT_1611837 [Mycena leptocephala]
MPSSVIEVRFAFDGEYSVIVVDRDIIGRWATVGPRMHNVKNTIEHATGLDFRSSGAGAVLVSTNGIVMCFTCSHIIHVLRLFPQSQTPTLVPQKMQGELEIIVIPNDSHKFFPGEKTIVRFRLFG